MQFHRHITGLGPYSGSSVSLLLILGMEGFKVLNVLSHMDRTGDEPITSLFR